MVICGVDGGGTKTKIAIEFPGGTDELVVGPSSIDTIDIHDSIEVVKNGIHILMEKHNLKRLDSIFIGLGGIAVKDDVIEYNTLIHNSEYIDNNTIVNIENDIMNAYFASCNGRNNITLIVGTGSVMFGMDEEGNSHRCSGIHYLEGDLGSGYDIGSRALKCMSKAFDRRIEHTQLTKYLLQKFSIQSFGDLVLFYTRTNNDRTFIASLAKTVVEYAEKGDSHAISCLEEGAKEIALGVRAVDEVINLSNKEIGIIGSLGNSTMYHDMIRLCIHEYNQDYLVHGSELDPVQGALFLSKRFLDLNTHLK